MGESLLTVQDVADRLKVSESTVRRLIDQGAIPIVRIGRQIRIRPEDVEKYIKQQTEA